MIAELLYLEGVINLPRIHSGIVRTFLLLAVSLASFHPASALAAPSPLHVAGLATTNAAWQAPAAAGQPLTPAQLASLLPEKVFFQSQSAPIQLRNAGGIRFAGGYVLAALVDTSGYSTGVQEKYQFYLIVETDVRFGGQTLHPGAYGAGFIGADRFLLMDIGGHTIAEGATSTDSALGRPRPLQIVAERPDAVRLYLGRRYVSIEALSPQR